MKLEKLNSQLYSDICKLVEEARTYLASTANKTLTLMYWKIGNRINTDLLDGKRATYGKEIVSQLATQLQQQYGRRGFQERNIRRMMQFAELFSDFKIVSQAATKLSWSHFIELLSFKEDVQRANGTVHQMARKKRTTARRRATVGFDTLCRRQQRTDRIITIGKGRH